ncbi:MAG: Ig-like domain-containing protein [Hadesarchaea archaeon]|nr:Ig-like domain-containing protein [Hadesarchaea archaeon]
MVPFEVTATASDNLSGVASVELFYRYSPDNIIFGSWVSYSADNEEPWSWTFDTPEGDVYYEFHSIATDEANNVEEGPEVADTVCGVDTVPPESSVNRIEPYWQNVSMVPFEVLATASDNLSGVASVELYYHYSVENTNWNTWTSYSADNEEPWSWIFDAPEGDGYYEFCTLATDVAFNTEPVPDQVDLNLGVDTTPTISSVDSIEPYWQEPASFAVSVTALDVLSGVADVELYYQSSIDNVNWGEWKLFSIDNMAPYEWSFTAPDCYALYQFYSVATDVAGNVENAPEAADATCCTVIPAEIDIDPDTLNLKSQGRWITAYIELPGVYDLAGIDLVTITLEGVVPTELHPTEIGDHDGDGIPDLMIKFDRSAVQSLVSVGEVELAITGKWQAVLFKGSDIIRVIEPGKEQRGNRPEVPPGQSDEHPGKRFETPPGQSGEHPSQGQGEVSGGQGKTKDKDK